MNLPVLSICIPTFNGSKTIAGTLESLLVQATPEFEVIIGDNGSIDDTVSICNSFKGRGLNIRVIVNSVNFGFDYNLSNIIFSASGKYCWMLGDDDYIKAGAISYLVSQLTSTDYDLITCNTLLIDRNSAAKYTNKPLKPLPSCRFYDSAKDYFSDFKTNSTFMSINIIKKARWRDLWSVDMIGRFYVHYEVILGLLRVSNPLICHVNETLVFKTVRGDEDDFAKSPTNRIDKFYCVISLLEAINIHCPDSQSKVVADACKREVCRCYLLDYIRMTRASGRRLKVIHVVRLFLAIWPSPLLIPAVFLMLVPYRPLQFLKQSYYAFRD